MEKEIVWRILIALLEVSSRICHVALWLTTWWIFYAGQVCSTRSDAASGRLLSAGLHYLKRRRFGLRHPCQMNETSFSHHKVFSFFAKTFNSKELMNHRKNGSSSCVVLKKIKWFTTSCSLVFQYTKFIFRAQLIFAMRTVLCPTTFFFPSTKFLQ